MVKIGFPLRWIDPLMDCIPTLTLGFVINGKVSSQVVPSRGLRQGCPLVSPLISHLFFVDDNVLFCKATVASCEEIRRVLQVYQRGSRQMVNLQKSNITFNSNVSCYVRAEIQAVFEVGNAQTHDKYLALPTLVGKNKTKTFADIKDRVWKKLRSWKSGLFSFEGKEVLIKAVVQAVSTYTMSIFQLSGGLCKDLGAMSSGFWWCARSIDVWALTFFFGPIASFQGLSCVDVLYGFAGCLRIDDLECVCMILWGLWQVRNEVVQQGTSRVDDSMVDRLLSSLKEFQAGLLKLNTDASVKNGILMCGIGAVIRDDKGWIVAALSKPMLGNFSPETGKLVVLRDGLLLANSLHWKISCVELDACNVVSKLSNGSVDLDESEFVTS
ncbi:hypothetical protein Dsin_028564 [Dipteronia sinensis]|uniref:RNase H type-1 domain-containing protein n=1 Tax=Dipteronia sinensis TaxID=43782 RepID=A0AAD9ZQZ4_9ROSI|nr:hypothetical protein Dsin_028564 [Dipteronia sinensis]